MAPSLLQKPQNLVSLLESKVSRRSPTLPVDKFGTGSVQLLVWTLLPPSCHAADRNMANRFLSELQDR